MKNFGTKKLYKIIFDRIEAGTYLIAALIGKKLVLNKIDTSKPIWNWYFKKMGANITRTRILQFQKQKIKKINITTKPYPGFPTDLQAQLMVLMTQAQVHIKIKENILKIDTCIPVKSWEPNWNKNKTAYIFGASRLTGAEVMATDLRASVVCFSRSYCRQQNNGLSFG